MTTMPPAREWSIPNLAGNAGMGFYCGCRSVARSTRTWGPDLAVAPLSDHSSEPNHASTLEELQSRIGPLLHRAICRRREVTAQADFLAAKEARVVRLPRSHHNDGKEPRVCSHGIRANSEIRNIGDGAIYDAPRECLPVCWPEAVQITYARCPSRAVGYGEALGFDSIERFL